MNAAGRAGSAALGLDSEEILGLRRWVRSGSKEGGGNERVEEGKREGVKRHRGGSRVRGGEEDRGEGSR